MSGFKNILVALDLSGDVDSILAKGATLADKFNATLSLVHVVEPILLDVNMDFAPEVNIDLESSLIKRAESFLAHTIDRLKLRDTSCKVVVGSIKHEIHREAEKMHADLIVIGSHGRHGFALLLGSTANSVLHGAPCDVLTVKIRQ